MTDDEILKAGRRLRELVAEIYNLIQKRDAFWRSFNEVNSTIDERRVEQRKLLNALENADHETWLR